MHYAAPKVSFHIVDHCYCITKQGSVTVYLKVIKVYAGSNYSDCDNILVIMRLPYLIKKLEIMQLLDQVSTFLIIPSHHHQY